MPQDRRCPVLQVFSLLRVQGSAELRLHECESQEVVMVHDKPWGLIP
jgi:hypothetical protein